VTAADVTTRLVLVGGFLGAGKTTLLINAAKTLAAGGRRVGIVTNDQAEDLVDTALARQCEIPVTEVAGGCFCCRFPDLLASIERLQEMVDPDIVLAEAVGSCTDLVSTVLRPLHAYHPDRYLVAPFTVLSDPLRDPYSFPTEVSYIHERQLSEANLIAVSKRDLLDTATTQRRLDELARAYPAAEVLALSGRTGEGLPKWLDICVRQSARIDSVLEMDYEIYAQGEACLGWLNAKGRLSAPVPFSPALWVTGILHGIQGECQVQDAPIAHVKIHVTVGGQALKASLTQLDGPVSWDLGPTGQPTTTADFVLNARVTATPDVLEALVRRALARTGARLEVALELTELSCFSPAPPRPIHRLLSL
jgi:Ni2+-binding GTPase involved in maturation of urease and hydrogenase